MADKGIGTAECPTHGEYHLDATDSPCPSCEDTPVVTIALGPRRVGVQVHNHLPFVCVDCKKQFFYTTKNMSRWRAECLHQATEHTPQCSKCEAEADFRRTKEYAKIKKDMDEARLKKERLRSKQRNARTKRVHATIVCDRCETEHKQSAHTLSGLKWPKGWTNFSAHPAETSCPECTPKHSADRKATQDSFNEETYEVKEKLRDFHKKDKQVR